MDKTTLLQILEQLNIITMLLEKEAAKPNVPSPEPTPCKCEPCKCDLSGYVKLSDLPQTKDGKLDIAQESTLQTIATLLEKHFNTEHPTGGPLKPVEVEKPIETKVQVVEERKIRR
jgi:hypothetical protein